MNFKETLTDNGGAVDLQDAVKIAKQLLDKEKLKANQAALADVNQNGIVDL